MENKRQLKKHKIRNKKKSYLSDYKLKEINKRNKYNTIGLKRKQKIKQYKLKYIKYINN